MFNKELRFVEKTDYKDYLDLKNFLRSLGVDSLAALDKLFSAKEAETTKLRMQVKNLKRSLEVANQYVVNDAPTVKEYKPRLEKALANMSDLQRKHKYVSEALDQSEKYELALKLYIFELGATYKFDAEKAVRKALGKL